MAGGGGWIFIFCWVRGKVPVVPAGEKRTSINQKTTTTTQLKELQKRHELAKFIDSVSGSKIRSHFFTPWFSYRIFLLRSSNDSLCCYPDDGTTIFVISFTRFGWLLCCEDLKEEKFESIFAQQWWLDFNRTLEAADGSLPKREIDNQSGTDTFNLSFFLLPFSSDCAQSDEEILQPRRMMRGCNA